MIHPPEKIAFDAALQEDFAAIERIEDSATKAQSEAAAAAEVNVVLGVGEEDSSS